MSERSNDTDTDLRRQAAILCKYLIKETPTERVAEAYADIVARKRHAARPDDRAFRYAMTHPWSLSLLDSAAAIARPNSELRYRLFTMFAVLECQPEYSSRFLSESFSKLHVLRIAAVGCKAVAKAICGFILMKALRV